MNLKYNSGSVQGHRSKSDENVSSSIVDAAGLLSRYQRVRANTDRLVVPLVDEDRVVQSMTDASPVNWHIAHTTWFFETFLLIPHLPDYEVFDPAFSYLFNSYYEAIGPRQPRQQRGLLTRPTGRQITAYRRHVDQEMEKLMSSSPATSWEALVQLGIAHEEQHQELLLMDILHLFSQSPLKPAYDSGSAMGRPGRSGRFKFHAGGLHEVGNETASFVFDNELPRHKTWIEPFEISDRLITNRQWLAFMDDGGYTRASLWLADGWRLVNAEQWTAPLYWERADNDTGWQVMTLAGLCALDLDAPVTHISYYEACAFAAWAGARLPTEAEWECAASSGLLEQVDDTAWQWTQSAYSPYPGFRASPDAVGEYNGKFMVGQMVLRGGSSATPLNHVRHSYRNFYYPQQRWMFSGLRLARDVVDGLKMATNKTAFKADIFAGLSAHSKSTPPKYFYDDIGSALFEEICKTSEYYVTRIETALLSSISYEIARGIPSDATLVEFGSGASDKTRLILDAAPQINTYVPIDISPEALFQATNRLSQSYPNLQIVPLAEDFTRAVALPEQIGEGPRIGFFPGSTIGNFTPGEATSFLRAARKLLGTEARLIIGVDMIKDPATLQAAYDDRLGVTARFNKNLLTRINRELNGNFDLNTFDHLALWNEALNRMEMHLVSRLDQIVHIDGHSFAFRAGERIHTESSHKFSIDSFEQLAVSAGWMIDRYWVSDDPEFSIWSLRSAKD